MKAQLQNLNSKTFSDQGAVIAQSAAIAAPPKIELLVNIRKFYPTVREHTILLHVLTPQRGSIFVS